MFGLKRFEEKCEISHEEKIKKLKEWQKIFDKQQKYGIDYVFISGIFSNKCPNCKTKLKKTFSLEHLGELYEIFTCKKCSYEFAVRFQN